MAEQPEKDSKTEEATPRKLEEARRKGDVAKSQDLPSFMALAAAFGVLLSAGTWLSQGLAEALVPFVAAPHELAVVLTTGGAGDVAWNAIKAALPLLLAVLAAAAVAGAGGNLLQTGVLFAPEKLKPDWKKVNPLSGFGRLFGPEGLFQFGKSLFKVVIVGWVCWLVLAPHVGEIESLVRMEPAAILPFAQDLLSALFYAVLAFLALTSAIDFVWQKLRFAERMRMTKEEVKEDYKQTEGDPHVKGKLKQLRAEKAKRRMMAEVPKATVVVTNPTHFAVALRYVAGETAAPVCVAKGVDSLALKIREVAGEHGVPLVEDKPLARALYAAVDVDETIPREHFEAVAKVIGFVLGKKARSR
jgi:flagellar biosynthetic protein FlhB